MFEYVYLLKHTGSLVVTLQSSFFELICYKRKDPKLHVEELAFKHQHPFQSYTSMHTKAHTHVKA